MLPVDTEWHPCFFPNQQSMEQNLRKEFFAYRNGIIADQLRAAGDPHTMIMGCQLIDVINITSHYEKSASLAQSLWNDVNHRECRMAAIMLYPIMEFDMTTALAWCDSIESTEIADVLCHRLLRHLPCAVDLWDRLRDNNKPLVRYTAWRLLLNLLLMNRVKKTKQLKDLLNLDLKTAAPPLQQLLKTISQDLQ